MAEINFLPVCSNCSNVIRDVIDYSADDELDGMNIYGREKHLLRMSHISPYKCPICNAPFESIIIPTRLPYDNSSYKVQPSEKYGIWIKDMIVRETEKSISYTPVWYCPNCKQPYDAHNASRFIKYCYRCGMRLKEG